MPERLRTLRHSIFTGGVVEINDIYAPFCEKVAQKRPQAFLSHKL